MISIYDYNQKLFPFTDVVQKILDIENLEKSHLFCESIDIVTKGTDQKTPLHPKYYKNMDSFLVLYERFIRFFIVPLLKFENSIIYQKIPTFRVHFPGNLAVAEFHKDSDYFHQLNEVNVWLPLTDAFDTNTIWIESEPGLEDYKGYDVKKGQVLIFPGSKLKHGNLLNTTGLTRISLDFRLLREVEYDSNYTGKSINMNSQFIVGDYYKKIDLKGT